MQQRWWWLVFAVYFGLIAFMHRNVGLMVLGWIVGGLISLAFTMVDRLVHVYVMRPEEQLSVYVRHLVNEHRYKDALVLLKQRGGEQRFLMSRSVVFLVAFIPLSIYVLSSTGSMLAAGLLMGIGLQLVWMIAAEYKNSEALRQLLFWPIKRRVSETEMWMVIGVFGLVFGWLSISLGVWG